MKKVLIYIKHFLTVLVVLLLLGFALLVSEKGSIGFSENELAFKVGGEGPHLFYENNHLTSLSIDGDRESGYRITKRQFEIGQPVDISVYFALDDSRFDFTAKITDEFVSPAPSYNDQQAIFAMSDLEGNYKAFREMLKSHNIIDQNLHWNFDQGHLVLVGDMVDRGHSTTQLLWLIYKLEQEAQAAGGQVHYIVGNHEIKNLQGNFRSASDKYIPVAGMIGKSRTDLISQHSFFGRWIASKNSIESINGILFTHGGLHPKIATIPDDLAQINDLIRREYTHYYYPQKNADEVKGLLVSNQTGLAWYRGLFKDQVSPLALDKNLKKFQAKALVVGHSIQFKVNKQYQGKLFAIDVKHPSDYQANFPAKSSEALYIINDQYYRVLEDGTKILL